LNPSAGAVYDLMTEVFGKDRTIDGRPLSVNTGRSSDGVHFTPSSATETAKNIAQALLAKNPASRWLSWGLASLGVAGLLGILWMGSRRAAGKPVLGLPPAPEPEIDPDDPTIIDIAEDAYQEHDPKRAREILKQLSPEGQRRRQGKAYLEFVEMGYGDESNSATILEYLDEQPDVPLARYEAIKALKTDMEDPEAIRDWQAQHEDEIAYAGLMPDAAWASWYDAYLTASKRRARDIEAGGAARTRARNYGPEGSKTEAEEPVLGATPSWFEEKLQSNLGAAKQTPEEKAKEKEFRWEQTDKIWGLIQDPDPAAMTVAEDLALENQIKLREFGRGQHPTSSSDNGSFMLKPAGNDPTEPSGTRVSWSVEPFSQGAGQIGFWTEMRVVVDGQPILMTIDRQGGMQIEKDYKTIRTFEPRDSLRDETIADIRRRVSELIFKRATGTATKYDEKNLKLLERQLKVSGGGPQTERERKVLREKATKAAVADAWAVAKLIKNYGEPAIHPRAREAALREQIDALLKETSAKGTQRKPPKPAELYGLGIIADIGATKRADPKRHFLKMLHDPDPGALIVAEDYALENDLKLSEIFPNKNHPERGVIFLSALQSKEEDRGWGFLHPTAGPNTNVVWEVPIGRERRSKLAPNEHDSIYTTTFNQSFDDKTGFKIRVVKEFSSHGDKTYASRKAMEDAWAIAKAVKALPIDSTEAEVKAAMEKALDKDNSEPEELYGAGLGEITQDQRSATQRYLTEAKQSLETLETETKNTDSMIGKLRKLADSTRSKLQKLKTKAIETDAFDTEDEDARELIDSLEEALPPDGDAINGAHEVLEDDWKAGLKRFRSAISDAEGLL
jgi:hypothetical protein